MTKKGKPNRTAAGKTVSGGPGMCGACAGSGVKPGRWMSPCDGPCPMCAGRGHGGRAAGVPPERYMDWILDGCRTTASAGAPPGTVAPSEESGRVCSNLTCEGAGFDTGATRLCPECQGMSDAGAPSAFRPSPGQTDVRRALGASLLDRVRASTGAEHDGLNPGNLVVGVTAHCACGRTFTDDVRCGFAESGPTAVVPAGDEVPRGGKGMFRRLNDAVVGAVMFASGLGALLRFRRRHTAKLAGWPVRGRVHCKLVEDARGEGYVILDRDDEELGELRFDGTALRSGPKRPGRLYATYEDAAAVGSAINSLNAAPSGRPIAPPWTGTRP